MTKRHEMAHFDGDIIEVNDFNTFQRKTREMQKEEAEVYHSEWFGEFGLIIVKNK